MCLVSFGYKGIKTVVIAKPQHRIVESGVITKESLLFLKIIRNLGHLFTTIESNI